MKDKMTTLGIILGILIIITGCVLGIMLARGEALLQGLAALIVSFIYSYFVIKSSRRGTNEMQSKGIIVSLVGFAILAVSALMTYLICFLELFGPIIDKPMCVYAVFIFVGVYPAAILFVIGTIIFIVGLIRG